VIDVRAWPWLAAVALCVVACTPDGSAGTVAATPRATVSPEKHDIADQPPYLCNFIPQGAVSALTGYSGRYSADRAERSASHICGIRNDKQSIVSASYTRDAPRKQIDTWMRNGAEDGREKLPRELGVGALGDYEIREYAYRAAGAWFRCGEDNSLITLYIMKNPARDQDHDLIQLMRIAQRRFSEMFDCELGGAPA